MLVCSTRYFASYNSEEMRLELVGASGYSGRGRARHLQGK
jgi:hypothetical protein